MLRSAQCCKRLFLNDFCLSGSFNFIFLNSLPVQNDPCSQLNCLEPFPRNARNSCLPPTGGDLDTVEYRQGSRLHFSDKVPLKVKQVEGSSRVQRDTVFLSCLCSEAIDLPKAVSVTRQKLRSHSARRSSQAGLMRLEV